ncbi:uncharacterized protein LOC122662312 isoform X1 [Telopea speciosissima]|uniref:uncharacterized protein LOC122662312 isoform X1 n=1 Tax=Telopea speciosissima TaxID=54955 RepID=UPI001CC629D3|nr:uncharacterized protein LOC122662312 isoform X1 [Telopea speciosissima]
MASLQIIKSSLCPLLGFRADSGRKIGWFCSDSQLSFTQRKILKLQNRRVSNVLIHRAYRVCCRLQDGESESNSDEPPESLFMKELRRRGMTPTSLLEDSNRSSYGLDEEIKLEEDSRGFSKRNAVLPDFEKSLSNQRERSMALNSEGLEGLIPRAKLLLTIGGTFFLGFWPLILVTVAFFSALYLYFGPSFVQDASKTPTSPPPYIDPYALLEDERMLKSAPHVN